MRKSLNGNLLYLNRTRLGTDKKLSIPYPTKYEMFGWIIFIRLDSFEIHFYLRSTGIHVMHQIKYSWWLQNALRCTFKLIIEGKEYVVSQRSEIQEI